MATHTAAEETDALSKQTDVPKLSGRLPSLDGWRAVSILLVLGAHCKVTYGFPPRLDPVFKWLFDGSLGVQCFFVISGFIITWLLLRERQSTGSISLRAFYARRAIRILPVYWAFLAVVGIISLTTAYHQRLAIWLTNLTFTTNFADGPWTTGHLWSLAVEEQFYLVWPVTVVWLGDSIRHRRTVTSILAVPFALAAVSRVLGYVHKHDVHLSPLYSAYSFFSHFDSLACGCAAAVSITEERVVGWFRRRRLVLATASAVLMIVPYSLSKLFLLGKLTVPFGATAQAIGLAVLISLSVVDGKLRWWTPLNWRIVRAVGVLSYSLYIWQMLFCTSSQTYGVAPKWWLSWPSWLVALSMVATASYYGFELPLMRLRARFRRLPHRDERV
jgi:peptidoglycan/LPS O-acetylase OafA/YrhL